MKLSQRLTCLLFATIFVLVCSIGIFASDLTITNILEQNEEFVNQGELLPAAARGCTIPQDAYDLYAKIKNNEDVSAYNPHTYKNVTDPKLPGGTTYTTYYLPVYGNRLVVGANGTAFFSPNHYTSWIKLNV